MVMSPVIFQMGRDAWEWDWHPTLRRNNTFFGRQVGPSLRLLLTTIISTHATGFEVTVCVILELTRWPGVRSSIQISHSFLVRAVSPHRTQGCAPHSVYQSVESHALCGDWQRSPRRRSPGLFPNLVSRRKPAKLLQACFHTDPFSQLLSF